MTAKIFLDLALAHDGNYCTLVINTSTDTKQQKFYSSIDELIESAIDFDSYGFDVYYAPATFTTPGSRKADNVKWVKSFFLDLDCGPGKEFSTQQKAVTELKKFCKSHNLPRPTVINSGRGVHVYWILSAPVSREAWLPVAERLKILCNRADFPADPAITADIARVLRVPSTHNRKDVPPNPVKFMGDIASEVDFDAFSALMGDEPVRIPPSKAVSAFREAMQQNEQGSFIQLIKKTKAGKGCAQIKYIIENQETVPHDLWRAGLSIANICVDSEKAARIMSHKHPDYNEDVTLKKMEDTGGPQFCKTFEIHNPSGCMGCSNKSKISTPATLTKEIIEAAPEAHNIENILSETPKTHGVPALPPPYIRGKNGGVYLKTEGEDGDIEYVCVYHYDFYVTHRLHDVELGEVIAFALHLPKDGIREFTIPLACITSKEDFRKNMAMKGITSYGKDIDKLMAYITTWIKELQQSTTASEASQQFGWVDDEKRDAFVLGDKLITADEVVYNPPSAKTSGLIDAFIPKGTKERQREILQFFSADGLELHQFTILGGFGSILMSFTGLNSLGVHLQGGSGVGKTTALFCNMSVWGDPHFLTLGEEDTTNSRMHRGEIMHNLPLNTDEMTNKGGLEISRYAYKLTEGKQKNRMAGGSNTERVRGRIWKLLAFSTGNESCYQQMQMVKGSPQAEMQRILELRVDPNLKAVVDKGKTDDLYADIQNNYGHFAVEYVQYIIRNNTELAGQFKEIKTGLDKAAGLTAENRFWSAGCTAIILACTITNRLGITNYDAKKLFKWVVEELKKVKSVVDNTAPQATSVLTEFVMENWSNILKIKNHETSKKGDGETMVIPEANPRMFVARYETDTNMLYIPPKAFREYLSKRHLSYDSAVEDMVKNMGAERMTMRLCRGTNFNLPPIRVIAVRLKLEMDDVPGITED